MLHKCFKLLPLIVLMVLGTFQAASAAQSYCDDIQTLVTTTPVIEQGPAKLKQARQQQRVQLANPKLLVVGDSIAFRWGPTLRRDFPTISAQNFGVGADKTQETLWRLTNLRPAVDPKVAIIIIGTNNITDNGAAPCGVAAGIIAVAKQVRENWPTTRIVIVPILPRGPSFAYRKDAIAETNKIVSDNFAQDSSIAIAAQDEASLTCSWSSSKCVNFDDDMLHPSSQGYVVLAESVKQAAIRRFGMNPFE
ncbi:GDSL-type esterase/lipase family protein [Oryzifoliimicrobium ureilyticus]|uniref:GDSL-type esterase/lipase family protein n=1 Tax=Oryzifoliimicrobium ureilyticus TaxID=3113724 RepID=UPI0030766D45